MYHPCFDQNEKFLHCHGLRDQLRILNSFSKEGSKTSSSLFFVCWVESLNEGYRILAGSPLAKKVAEKHLWWSLDRLGGNQFVHKLFDKMFDWDSATPMCTLLLTSIYRLFRRTSTSVDILAWTLLASVDNCATWPCRWQ